MSFIYSDEMKSLLEEGQATVTRASHVEPHPDGGWTADMGPVNGPILGPFNFRQTALNEEVDWLNNEMFGGNHEA